MTLRTTSRIGSAAMFVLILICASTFVLSAPVAAEDGLTADRTDVDTVTVSLDQDINASLSISDPEGVDWNTSWDTESNKSISISEIHDETPSDADLTEATIFAEFDTGENDTATVPLHKVERDDTHTSWVSDDELHVPLDSTNTVGTGDSVTVVVNETDVDGDIHNHQSHLSISHDELVTEASIQDEIALTPKADDTEIGSEIILRPDLRTVDQTQHLYHPAFDGDTSYNLTGYDIDTEPSDARIDVSSASLGDQLEIAFEDDDLPTITVEQRDVPELEGTGTAGNSTLNVDGLPSGLSSATVFVVEDDDSLSELGDAEISSVELEDESFASPDRVILQTQAGLFDVTDIDWSDPDDEDDDSTFLGIFSIDFGFYHGAFLGVFVAGLLTGLTSYGLFGRQQGHSFEPVLAAALWVMLTGVFIIVLTVVVEVDLLIDAPDVSDISDFVLIVGIAIAGGLIGTASYTVPTFVWTGSSTSATQKRPVRFNITRDGQPVTQNVIVEATPISGSSSTKTRKLNPSQSDTHELEPGTWEFTVLYGRNNFPAATTRENVPSGSRTPHSVSIGFEAAQVQIGITDERTGDPVTHGTVQFKAAGKSEQKRLSDGTAAYDPPKQASSVKIHISCDKYESRTIERDIAQTNWPIIESIKPQLGSLDLTSTIDGEQIGNMTVEVVPDEEVVQKLWKRSDITDVNGTLTATTDTNGSYAIGRRDKTTPPLFAGSYTVRVHPPETNNQYFQTDEQTVDIKNRQKSRIDLSVPFTWSTDQHQRRIDDLRSDVQELSSQTHRDVAVPEYFGTVMLSALDAVEQISDQGHLFSEYDRDPDDVADALLTAIDELTHVIDDAMSTKRNVDLFSACSNLPEASVQWNESFSLPELLDRSNQSLATSRSSFAEELEDTSERIQSERQELTELSPVKELHSRVSDNAPSSHGDNDLEAVATLYLSELLLDAIQQAFDEPDIRKRLDQTVF